MLSVEEARRRLLARLTVVGETTISIDQADGRVLAGSVTATNPYPLFANSSMDGFALRAADAPGGLEVVGDIPAGRIPEKALEAGQAMRIMTGAPLPEGADAVVPVEQTDFNFRDPEAPLPERVEVKAGVDSGQYVRPRGQDFPAGTALLSVGQRLRPQDVGMLAMAGMAEVKVYQRPKVALLSTGDELLAAGEPLQPGKIHETNSHTLAAQLRSCGAEPLIVGVALDRFEAVQALMARAVESGADLIVSSAGVSVGAFDYVRNVLEAQGSLDFWRVNMRPGKPLAFGEYRQVPFVGLPGNPVSSFVGFEVFLRPAVNKMGGDMGWLRRKQEAYLSHAVESDGRESYLRAVLSPQDGQLHATLTGHQGSGNLLSLVQANALIVVPAGVTSLPAGSLVEAWPLD